MVVSGRELASLDFANLIGGPLNAVVEAQAKSAITTVNFIKEAAFDKNGNIVNVDFKYNRKNDNGQDQQFTLTVPFLTMLPVPYITVNSALIEFNAKITSVNESSAADELTNNTNVDAGSRWWFASARVLSKTSYQRKTASSEKEERTFDMHVKVEAKNQDMPAGTERLLTILENSISERTGNTIVKASVTKADSTNNQIIVTCDDGGSIDKGQTFFTSGKNDCSIADAIEDPKKKGSWTLTLATGATPEWNALEGKTIELENVIAKK